MRLRGYILLEVIIASAISAMLSTMLLASLTQLNRSVGVAYDMMSLDSRLIIFFRQLERDISGAIVPMVAKQQETRGTSASTVSSSQPASAQQQSQEIRLEPLQKFFYAKQDEKGGLEFSFITCNPVPTYNLAKPHIARIIYRLQPEQNNKNAWQFMRQELTDLALPEEQPKGDAYMLVDGVKDVQCEFFAAVQERSSPGAQQRQQPQQKTATVSEWPTPEIREQGLTYLPQKVTVHLTIWDDRYKRDTKVSYSIPIFVPHDTPLAQQRQRAPTRPATPGISGGTGNNAPQQGQPTGAS